MNEHSDYADKLEREADSLDEQSERLGDDIEDTKKTWHERQADAGVPGAVGDPPGHDAGDDVEEAVGDASNQSEDPPPESQGPG